MGCALGLYPDFVWPQRARDSSFFSGNFVGALEGSFLAPFQFIAYGPVIFPDEVFGVLRSRIHEHQGPLKIVKKLFIGKTLHVPQEAVVKPLGLLLVAPSVEEDKGFPQLDVLGLLDISFANDHDTAESQHSREGE